MSKASITFLAGVLAVAPLAASGCATNAGSWGFRSTLAEAATAETFTWGPTRRTCELALATTKSTAQKAADVFGACQPMTVAPATYSLGAQGVGAALGAVVGSWWGFTISATGHGQAANSKELCDGLRKQRAEAAPCVPVWVTVGGAR